MQKQYVEMTKEQVEAMWHLHQAQTKCTSKEIFTLKTKDGKLVGFECACGYRYENLSLTGGR
jgi:hypothetical protein